jgi:hypothetical protein
MDINRALTFGIAGRRERRAPFMSNTPCQSEAGQRAGGKGIRRWRVA